MNLYEGLRVTDVCDGLDSVGLIDTSVMDWEIRPLWRDIENFSHRICGFAHTVRFVPTNRVVPRPLPIEEFKKWKADWYAEVGGKMKATPSSPATSWSLMPRAWTMSVLSAPATPSAG